MPETEINNIINKSRPIQYEDHIGLWEKELKDWVPEKIFDAHVHLGPPGAVGEMTPDRLKLPLTTYTHLTLEEAKIWYEKLYSTKTLDGLIAFPFPLQEVDLEAANRYIVTIMQEEPGVKGFIWSDPRDAQRTVRQFQEALKKGLRFYGVKPHFDLLGKSNYETTMPEFMPRDLLGFMDKERLILMLHTSGIGMGDKANQEFVMLIADDFPGIKIVLAHMGRYLKLEQFADFFKSGVLDYPSVFLEMSSATMTEVYEMVLGRKDLWSRILFGSDIPYGLITGVEFTEGQTPTFMTRDQYLWSDEGLSGRDDLTYNTYHVIKALKDALENLDLDKDCADKLKTDIFFRNAKSNLLGE